MLASCTYSIHKNDGGIIPLLRMAKTDMSKIDGFVGL